MGEIVERAQKALKLPNKQFKRNIGTTKSVFQKMLFLLQTDYEKLHEPGGNPRGLTPGDKLLITLQYYLAVFLSVLILADSGYQGIQSYYAWSLIPIKKSKGGE